MANIEPPKWADSEAKEILEKDLKIGRIPLDEMSNGWTPSKVYNLEDRPQFRLFEYKKFVGNFRNLRKRIKELKQDGAAAALSLVHDRSIQGGIYRAAATNYQQGGAPRWDGSLAQKSLNKDIDEGKHTMMKPKQLHATRDEYKVFAKGVFSKHILQEVKTRKFLVYMKAKAEKKAEKKKKAQGST